MRFLLSLLLSALSVVYAAHIQMFDDMAGQKVYFSLLRHTKEPIYVGAIKLNPLLGTGKKNYRCFFPPDTERHKTYVILEKTLPWLSAWNRKSHGGRHVEKLSDTGAQPLFLPFANSHLKVLSTPTQVLIGTTNFDRAPVDCVLREFVALIDDPAIVQEVRTTLEALRQNKAVDWHARKHTLKELRKRENYSRLGPFVSQKFIDAYDP